MIKIRLDTSWQLGHTAAEEVDPVLFPLLRAIRDLGSLAQAAKSVGQSYRHIWGILGKWENLIGQPLAHLQRGRGAALTPFAEKLLWAESHAREKLAPTLNRLADELKRELVQAASNDRRPLVIHASHDLALAQLRESLARRDRMRLELRFQGSLQSLEAFSRERCDLAGFHIAETETQLEPKFARLLKAGSDCLIGIAVREQGLMLARGNPKRIHTLEDLTRRGVRFINRQPGSGTRIALDHLLTAKHVRRERIRGYSQEEFTHLAVAATVASGMADAGFGIRAAAVQYGLDFVRIERERYLLACRVEQLEQPLMQELLRMLRGRSFRGILKGLPGYDPDITGHVFDTALRPV